MLYLCIFHSSSTTGKASGRRYLNVPASDVPSAIEMLEQQMQRENEHLVSIIAIAPVNLLSVANCYSDMIRFADLIAASKTSNTTLG